MRIAITGTPGVGKTIVAKRLAFRLKYELVRLNDVIKRKKLYDSYDKKFDTYVVDVKKLESIRLPKNAIIDSHLSHFLKSDVVIVLRCEPKELEKRLKKKNWKREKVTENVEAELIGVISYEARKMHKNVFEIDTTSKSIDKIVAEIESFLKNRKEYEKI